MGKEGGHRKGSPGIDTHYFCSESMNENQAHMCTEMQRKLGTVAPSSKSILWMDGGYEIISAKVAKYINNIIYILYMYAQHIYIFFFFFGLFRATPAAYGSSQVRGQITAAAGGLNHSYSNTESELCL